jgi:acyl-CoA reductase-like NAD-dependent aldehyde dehydrogenase
MLINGHFIGRECDQAVAKVVIKAPFDDKIVGTVAEGGYNEVRVAIESADDAFKTWRHSSRRERQQLLRKVASSVRERSDELVEILSKEVGKPITASRGEVARLAVTFDDAADALANWGLEALPVDMDSRGEGYRCIVDRFPLGVIFCIVPYNWPFNLAAHKIAPALATGNTMVVKPSHLAPLSTYTLARIIHEAGCPPGVMNCLLCSPEDAEKGLHDPRVKALSFTGSPPVGWRLKKELSEKKVTLELGGNASAIVCEDADFKWAIPRIINGGFVYAGQICISIQHVLIHQSRYEEARKLLIEQTESCPFGDPMDEKVVSGPMISGSAADKVESFIKEAVDKGAKILAGGGRKRNLIEPTLMEAVPENTKLFAEEVFGPVMTIRTFKDLDEAISIVNKSQYGIHAGIFTHDIRSAEKAFRDIEVGGVIVNDYPTLRFDNMPYGGVKHSGFGREGVRYAMDDMTEPRVMLTRVT